MKPLPRLLRLGNLLTLPGAADIARSARAESIESRLEVSGLLCSLCANRVQRSLRRVPGVSDAGCSLTTQTAWVRHDETVSGEDLRRAVESAAFLLPLRRVLARLGRRARPAAATPHG